MNIIEGRKAMTRQGRKHSGTFKVEVALEALKGIKTIRQIAATYQIHPVQVCGWKNELQERMGEVF